MIFPKNIKDIKIKTNEQCEYIIRIGIDGVFKSGYYCTIQEGYTMCDTSRKNCLENKSNFKNNQEKVEIWNNQYSCPSCQIIFGCKDNLDKSSNIKKLHCMNCGQKINWD